MDTRTVQMLLDMNAAFYAQVGESFSQTRQAAWPGWERVVRACGLDAGAADAERAEGAESAEGAEDTAGSAGAGAAECVPDEDAESAADAEGVADAKSAERARPRVLDVGCGNMRFFRFLRERGIEPARYVGVDAAPVLPGIPSGAEFLSMDLLADLREAGGGCAACDEPAMPAGSALPAVSGAGSPLASAISAMPAFSESAGMPAPSEPAPRRAVRATFSASAVSAVSAASVAAMPAARLEQAEASAPRVPPASLLPPALPTSPAVPAPAMPSARLGQLGAFDMVVCFGFFHHIPGRGNRIRFLKRLAACTAEGGCLAVSLWRFLENDALAAKAQRATAAALEQLAQAGLAEADLEPGDRFLGWQETRGIFRYCHSFSDDEADELVRVAAEAGLNLVDRFLADGRGGNLNAYLVFAKGREDLRER